MPCTQLDMTKIRQALRALLLRIPVRRGLAPAAVAVAAIATGTIYVSTSSAADHNDPVRVQATGSDAANAGDPAADIADIFAYYTGTQGNPGSIVLALTWRTHPLYEQAFDPSVRYGIHIDKTDDRLVGVVDHAKADHDIYAWFGKNPAGEWGVQVDTLRPTSRSSCRRSLTTSLPRPSALFSRPGRTSERAQPPIATATITTPSAPR